MSHLSQRWGSFPTEGRTARAVLPLLVLLAFGAAPPAGAGVLLTQEEALALAFPGAEVERHTAYLDEEQLAAARRLAGEEAGELRALVPYYVATREGRPVGVAYFDTHLVRTEAATVMYVVGTDQRLQRVEMIAFAEPPDYLPRPAWLAQLHGRELDPDLALKRGIRPMTGATLTALGITAGARRVLALHQVIASLDGAPGAPDEEGRRP